MCASYLLVSAGGRRRFVVACGKEHGSEIGEGAMQRDHGPLQTMQRIRGLGVVDLRALGGRGFGERVRIAGEEFIVLRPVLSDILSQMRRGPQVITMKDMGAIIARCGISSGSRVVEVGTGSGALTIALAYQVKPEGRVYSYEERPENMKIARENLRMCGLEKYVELKCRRVEERVDEEGVDAFVADVPEPWCLVSAAACALVPGGMACFYVPTTNQMEQAAKALRGAGFSDIAAIEIIERGFETAEGAVRPRFDALGHTGYMLFGRWMGNAPN
ncbi:MAG: tRNA (adenine-N1)-methyltransferase [Candidatus Thermoplasmatota archaeon]